MSKGPGRHRKKMEKQVKKESVWITWSNYRPNCALITLCFRIAKPYWGKLWFASGELLRVIFSQSDVPMLHLCTKLQDSMDAPSRSCYFRMLFVHLSTTDWYFLDRNSSCRLSLHIQANRHTYLFFLPSFPHSCCLPMYKSRITCIGMLIIRAKECSW